MTSTFCIQLQSGAVHHATLPEQDLEKRMEYLMHLGSTYGVPKDMRENAYKWYHIYKYGGNNDKVNTEK